MEMEHYQREEAIFANVADTRQTEQLFNTTYNGSKVSLLNGGSTVIGPAVSLEVKPGDKIQLEVNAQFVQQSDDGLVTGLISFLAGTFGVTDGAGSETAHIYNGLENALTSLAGLISNSSNQPRAYLMCMVFDENYALIDPAAGNYDFYVPVPPEAATAYENLTLAIDIPTGGKYIYTYVANESAGTDVFFDDFTVAQLGVDITQTTDYYPFGSISSHWQKENYRFGYQGEYSEEDKETGFNHFELREYDPVIGRFTAMDPALQFWSPYSGMGNRPTIGIDPTGGECETCPGGKDYDYYRQSKYNWGYDESLGGNGTFQRLEEVVITAQGPRNNVPSWMLHKFARYETKLTLTHRYGVNIPGDAGIEGLSLNGGSYETFELTMNPQDAYDLINQGKNWEDVIKGSFTPKSVGDLSQGIRIETGRIDAKVKATYGGHPMSGRFYIKTLALGTGTAYTEAKVTFQHNSRHQLRIGSQEEWQIKPISKLGNVFEFGYFTGIVIDF